MDKKFFSRILREYRQYISLREEVIKSSRDVLKTSKQAIFLLHRDDIDRAGKMLDEIENMLMGMKKLFSRERRLQYEGYYKDCLEEFVEAKLFYNFLQKGNIEINSKVDLSFDDYLGGLCDLTGEILRKAVQIATQKKYTQLTLYQRAVEKILGELIKFDLTSKLRSKYDAAKRNLRRIEEIMYDVSVRQLR